MSQGAAGAFVMAQLTQKLIFKSGSSPSVTDTNHLVAESLLSEEALLVCKLLAIDPEDILPRDISQFQEDNVPGKKLSKQRIQLRFEYYEEKRQMKVKAIENILLKLQASKNGHPTPEALQVLALLNDVKNGNFISPKKKFDQSGFRNSSFSSGLRTAQNNTSNWKLLNVGPHSPGTRQPFVGGAFQQFNSGVHYKSVQKSPNTIKASRVLDQMPRNLIDQDNQSELKFTLQKSFFKDSPNGKNVQRTQSTMTNTVQDKIFDSFSLGFELPAGLQLNRITKKLEKWEKAQELAEKTKQERDAYILKLLNKEEIHKKKEEKAQAERVKRHLEKVKEREEKRETKAQLITTSERQYAQQVQQKVKEYYEDLKKYHLNKEETQKAIQKRMKEIYDSYEGEKAEEMRAKINAEIQKIEEGQILNEQIQEKIKEREQQVIQQRLEKMNQTQKFNNSRLQRAKSQKDQDDEKIKFQVLEKVVKKEDKFRNTLRKYEKEKKTHFDEKIGQVKEIWERVETNSKYVNNQHKEKVETWEAKQKQKEETAKKIKEDISATKAAEMERLKLMAKDVQENMMRIEKVKNFKNFKVLEKQIQKQRQISEYQKSVSQISQFY